jgi:hypothetical protein
MDSLPQNQRGAVGFFFSDKRVIVFLFSEENGITTLNQKKMPKNLYLNKIKIKIKIKIKY